MSDYYAYFVMVGLNKREHPHVATSLGRVKQIIDSVSGGDTQTVMMQPDGYVASWLITTSMTAQQIISELDSPGPSDPDTAKYMAGAVAGSPLTIHDQVFVLPVASDDVATLNVNQAGSWIRRTLS